MLAITCDICLAVRPQ